MGNEKSVSNYWDNVGNSKISKLNPKSNEYELAMLCGELIRNGNSVDRRTDQGGSERPKTHKENQKRRRDPRICDDGKWITKRGVARVLRGDTVLQWTKGCMRLRGNARLSQARLSQGPNPLKLEQRIRCSWILIFPLIRIISRSFLWAVDVYYPNWK